MRFDKRAAAILLVSIAVSPLLGCNPQSNSNKQTSAPTAKPKPAKWVAQYRSPASLNYSGVNLAVFYYSSISVVSPNVVYVCGDTPNPKGGDERVGVILRTTDGGQNWTEKPLEIPGMIIPSINAIHFVNPDVGWAVGVDIGGDGFVFSTNDAGASWAAIRIPHKQIPTTVFFTDQDHGWIGGSTSPPGDEEGMGGPSAILSTTDGGKTWIPQLNIPYSILRIVFADGKFGWASGTNGVIYSTSDAGLSWEKQRSEIETPDGTVDLHGEGSKKFIIRGLQFIDKDHGFAAASASETQAGRMLVTSNGGQAWSRQWMVAGAGVRDVFFLSPTEGWTLTDQGPYINHTVDGGRNWTSEPKIFEQDVATSRVAGADADHIWAVGGGAIFFRVTE